MIKKNTFNFLNIINIHLFINIIGHSCYSFPLVFIVDNYKNYYICITILHKYINSFSFQFSLFTFTFIACPSIENLTTLKKNRVKENRRYNFI